MIQQGKELFLEEIRLLLGNMSLLRMVAVL
jgi:hypothetical protein